MIVDYWVLRKQQLTVRDLYVDGGEYPLVHWPAMIALAAGIGMALIGLLVPALRVVYDYSWFVGFGVSGILYALIGGRR